MTTKTIYLALTANFWGRGGTERGALQQLKRAGGEASIKKHGHVVYEAHPDTRINDMGSFVHPKGCPPVKIADHRKGV